MQFSPSLKIREEIDRLFSPCYKISGNGALAFSYLKDGIEVGKECYTSEVHYVPATSGLWIVNHFSITSVKNLYLFPSGIEAISYFQLYPEKLQGSFPWTVAALGLNIQADHTIQLSGFNKAKKHFVFGSDLLGRVTDCKLALWFRNLSVPFCLKSGQIHFEMNGKTYAIPEQSFSLFRLQKLTGLRNLGRTIKPPSPYHSFYEIITNPIT